MIVACDGCADATAAACPRSGRRPRARAAARRQDPRAGRRRRARPRGRSSPSRTPTRCWEPDALRGAGRRLRRPARRLRLRPGALRAGRRRAQATNQEGLYWRYELALRALESRLRVDHRRQRRDLRHPPRAPTSSSTRSWATTCRFPSTWSSAAGAPSTCPSARASEKMVPSLEGEFARKRRMMSHTWPIVLRGGMLSPRGYPPGYALMIFSHRLLRYADAGLHVLALVANIALRRAGAGTSTWSRSRCSSRCCSPRCSPALLRARPLLIARYYVLTTASPAAGLWDWLRHGTAGLLGRRRGNAMITPRAARSSSLSPPPRSCSPRPLLARRDVAIRLESRGPAIYRQRRVGLRRRAVRHAQAAHDGRRRRAHRRRARDQRRTTRASRASARCCGAPRSTSCPTCSTCCAARCRSIGPRPTMPVAGRPVHRAPARAPGRQARHHRLGAGQRPRLAALVRADRARPATTSSTARSRSTCGSLRAPCARAAAVGLYKGETGGWDGGSTSGARRSRLAGAAAGEDPREPARDAHRRRQALRHRRLLSPS